MEQYLRLNTNESRGHVSREVLVTLLITRVLGDVVKVFTTDDESALHLGGDNNTGQDTTTDGDITSEGALLVDVGTLDGLLGGLEAETDILVPAGVTLLGLGVKGDTTLLLESLLNL
jgi:hypothetical protein